MATPPPEPPHSGVRPLSPWGEGYCRHCCFVVGLTYDGQLAEHTRGAQLMYPKPCKGGGTKAPKVTPYSSRKAAFRLSAPDVWCPACKQFVRSTRQGQAQVYERHPIPGSATRLPSCPYTMRLVERDHGSERG